MHNFVYILKSTKNGKLYIGYTANLKRRFDEHNKKSSGYTSSFRPWKIIYFEYYLSKQDALSREKQLKRHAKAYGQLKGRIKNSLLETKEG